MMTVMAALVTELQLIIYDHLLEGFLRKCRPATQQNHDMTPCV